MSPCCASARALRIAAPTPAWKRIDAVGILPSRPHAAEEPPTVVQRHILLHPLEERLTDDIRGLLPARDPR